MPREIAHAQSQAAETNGCNWLPPYLIQAKGNKELDSLVVVGMSKAFHTLGHCSMRGGLGKLLEEICH